ncbi:spermidine/putrescine ABC transporter substrate-binding protein [Clostridia bacterium]|nr:spermidine/putrescine ABC transporter substrate-binding protein [Clostridia bacterium]
MRREFKKIKLKNLILVAIIICVSGVFAGCGGKQTLAIYNAADYINGDVLAQFEKENKVKLIYNTYDSNEDMYARVTANPKMYDVIIGSDYMLARMIKEDSLQPLDMPQITNFSLVDSNYKALPFDATNKFSVPYMTGTLGIIYDAGRVTTTIDSWGALWDTHYLKNVLMLASPRDAIAVGLKFSGFSLNSHDPFQIDTARVKLQNQMRYIKWYQTDEIKDNIVQGRAILGLTYSGEAYTAQYKAASLGNPNIKYVIPKEGSNKWVDSFAIPKQAKNVALAHTFINYMLQADVAVKNSIATGYTSTQREVRGKLPAEMQNSSILYPTKGILDACEWYDYDIAASQLYQKAWMQVKAAR